MCLLFSSILLAILLYLLLQGMYIESVSKANKKIMLTNIYNRDQQQTIDSVNQTAFSIGVVYLSEASAEYQLASFVNAENNV